VDPFIERFNLTMDFAEAVRFWGRCQRSFWIVWITVGCSHTQQSIVSLINQCFAFFSFSFSFFFNYFSGLVFLVLFINNQFFYLVFLFNFNFYLGIELNNFFQFVFSIINLLIWLEITTIGFLNKIIKRGH
jgi:hypothetical protein